MQGDRSRLPRWAQEEMLALEREVQALNNQITVISGQEPKSPVQIDLRQEGEFYLPRHTTVVWELPGGKIRVQLNSDGKLTVMGDMGGGAFRVIPSASNSIHLEMADRGR